MMTSNTDSSVTRKINWKTVLDASTSVVMIAAAATVVSFQISNRAPSRPEAHVPSGPVSIEAAALKGSPSAATVLIVFSDFQCPYCGSFARETMPQLEREYVAAGRLQLAYRYLPLPKHQHALGAARAAECASRQGHFWAMHDRLFGAGARLDDDGLRVIVTSLDIDEAEYMRCFNEEASKAVVERDLKLANELGLASTPAFLLGTRTSDGRVRVAKAFYGALPIEQFRSQIDQVMSQRATGWFRGLFGVLVVGSKMQSKNIADKPLQSQRYNLN